MSDDEYIERIAEVIAILKMEVFNEGTCVTFIARRPSKKGALILTDDNLSELVDVIKDRSNAVTRGITVMAVQEGGPPTESDN